MPVDNGNVVHKSCRCTPGRLQNKPLQRFCMSLSYLSIINEVAANAGKFFGLGPIMAGKVAWEFSPIAKHGLVATVKIAQGTIIGAAECNIKFLSPT